MLLLRWAFHYQDGRKKHGLWSNDGRESGDKSHLAWAQSTEFLKSACIESKDIDSQGVVVLAEVNGQDFCCFQWVATAPMSYGSHQPSIIGLNIVSRDHELMCLSDGSMIPRKRSWEDKIMGYGKV